MDAQLPACLKRKLVFGDREQINALREMEREAQIEAENKAKGLKKYRVYVEVEANIDPEIIWAKSAKEAEQLAEDNIDLGYLDFDISAHAEEIKPNERHRNHSQR